MILEHAISARMSDLPPSPQAQQRKRKDVFSHLMETTSGKEEFNGKRRKNGSPPGAKHFTPLMASIEEVFSALELQNILPESKPMRGPEEKRDKTKYCWFYKD